MNKIFNLKNKNIIIFGGSGHLGKEFVKTLIMSEAKVHNCDVNEIDNKELTDSSSYFFHKVDATKPSELEKLKNNIISVDPKIDVLVNCTTMKGDDNYLPFEEGSLDSWEIGLKGDLTIPFLTIKTFISLMKDFRQGSVINIASVYGIVGNDQSIYEGSNLHEIYVNKSPNIKRVYANGVYNAAKGGLINFTKYLAAYYGEYNIRFNCISPGGIHNNFENETFVSNYSNRTPLGRKAKINEMNGALIFLSSDASSYVTGHNLVVDGGYSIW